MMLSKKLSSATAGVPSVYIEDVFSTYLYTGTGSTQTITNGIDLAGEGGLVWIKARNWEFGGSHNLFDTERGVRAYLQSNTTDAQITATAGYSLTSFNSDGFSLGINFNDENRSAINTASWTFRKAEKFFDVVTYAGDGTNNRAINHSLGSVPGFIIVKSTSATGFWVCYHRSLGSGNYLLLNLTNASNDVAQAFSSVTSTSFVPTSDANAFSLNDSGVTYVAYLFAHDAGGFGDDGTESVIKCGSYTGNGSSSGPTIDLGWEPQWILIKGASGGGAWYMQDVMRGMSETDIAYLSANASSAEATGGGPIVVPTSTGFKIAAGSLGWNAVSETYIYIAIRRGPMKTPTVGTEVFDTSTSSGASGTTITTNFAVDAQLIKNRTSVESTHAVDRLRGVNTTNATGLTVPYLLTASTNAEASVTNLAVSDNWGNTSFEVPGGFGSISTAYYSFRRAPGFFDVVVYAGTGVARTVSHNLGVVPELMIVKGRSGSGTLHWAVYSAATGATQWLTMQNDNEANSNSGLWNNMQPTSSALTVGTAGATNGNGSTYIAYLFASCSGVSKVGSYTGTGTTLNIDCGFTAGARFVLIKRTDSTGSWYVWDTARGIVSGDDPYLLLNSTAAEVTNTDYIDPLSSGFQISSTAPAAINASGGSFIFLAVA